MLWMIFVVSIWGFTEPPVSFYNAPSSSMADTIMIGDVFVAATDAYDHDDPRRCDVALLHAQGDPRTVYSKRVIGLPGDKVQMVDGRLVLNGTPVAEAPGPDTPIAEAPADARRVVETLPNGARYEILDFEQGGFLDDTAVFDVPAGNYFVLGDNRNDSEDSRYWGFVPSENIVGRPLLVYFSLRQDSDTGDVLALPHSDEPAAPSTGFHFARWDRTLRIIH